MTLAIVTRRKIVAATIKAASGRFITVDFIKKDGTFRTMNIQPETVKTHLAVNPSISGRKAAESRRKRHPNLLPVWDLSSKHIKSVNIDTVVSVRIDGTCIDFGL